MNKVVLVGRLTRDPELRYSQSDEPVAVVRLGIAVNRRFKRDGEPSADFINCIAFGKTGEFINKYFSKGKQIAICGRITTGSYIDNNDNKRYTTDVTIEEVEFVGAKEDNETQGETKPKAETKAENTTDGADDFYNVEGVAFDDDNLPF